MIIERGYCGNKRQVGSFKFIYFTVSNNVSYIEVNLESLTLFLIFFII